MKKLFVRALAILLLAIMLYGCSGEESFSAEDAAVKFGMENMHEGAVIDQESIKIRQVREMDENTKYVLFSFDRQMNNRPERCLMLYETRRNPIGMWVSGSGGGGCGGPVEGAAEEVPAIDSGGGSSTNSDKPLGTSQSYGVVNDDTIVKVRITWNDGAIFDADLVNSSYLVMRDGQFETTMIEGLDTDGAVVERVDWGRPAPGKE